MATGEAVKSRYHFLSSCEVSNVTSYTSLQTLIVIYIAVYFSTTAMSFTGVLSVGLPSLIESSIFVCS